MSNNLVRNVTLVATFSHRFACPGMKKIVKNCLHVVFLALALPWAAIAGFGRFLLCFRSGHMPAPWLPALSATMFELHFIS